VAKTKSFIASDGRIQIQLTPCREGGYLVTSPLDPELITQAESLEEAFINAHDAALQLARAKKPRARKRETAAARKT
jgi:antitoxin HicB